MGGDKRDYNTWIRDTLASFYEAYYNGDRLKFYSFFDTDFQIKVPLNVFVYHPNYKNINLGEFKDVLDIHLSDLKDEADVKISLKMRGDITQINIKMKKEFGSWKIRGDYIF